MYMLKRRFAHAFVCLLAVTSIAAAQQTPAPINPANYKAAVKVACVGDSITAGYRAGGKNAAWPGQLSRMLGDKWAVSNFGVSAKTLMKTGESYQNTPDFKGALELNPDVVIIMLGTNDTKPRLWARKAQFEADCKDMVQQFAALPAKPVVFLCYPPFVGGKNAYNIQEEPILEQIPMIDKVAAELKLGVIDVHGALKGKPDLLSDNVHPNKEGAVAIAKTIYKALTGQAAPEIAPGAPEPAKQPKRNKRNKEAATS